MTRRGSWECQQPAYLVSNGDGATASAIGLVYGRPPPPHQLCVFRLLREYWQNIGDAGFAEARRPLSAASVAAGKRWARRIARLTGVQRWCEKALTKGRVI